MVLPLTPLEQIRASRFIPDEKLVIYFSASDFSAVKANFNGRIGQAMPDLPDCKKDCETLRQAFECYGISDVGSGNIFYLNNPINA